MWMYVNHTVRYREYSLTQELFIQSNIYPEKTERWHTFPHSHHNSSCIFSWHVISEWWMPSTWNCGLCEQDRCITSISKMQSNTTFNICIAKRFFYIACHNNMFHPLYRPSSGCTLSYYKPHYTIFNVFVFGKEISCRSIKFAFRIITVAVELNIYSNIRV